MIVWWKHTCIYGPPHMCENVLTEKFFRVKNTDIALTWVKLKFFNNHPNRKHTFCTKTILGHKVKNGGLMFLCHFRLVSVVSCFFFIISIIYFGTVYVPLGNAPIGVHKPTFPRVVKHQTSNTYTHSLTVSHRFIPQWRFGASLVKVTRRPDDSRCQFRYSWATARPRKYTAFFITVLLPQLQ